MTISHVLLSCFSLALCGGNRPLVDAQGQMYTGIEGRSIRITCPCSLCGSRKLFCRGDCSKNILLNTTDDSYHKGKYSMHFYGGWLSGNMFVTVKHLSKSDEGLYRCSISSFPGIHEDVVLVVKGAATTVSTRPTLSVTAPEPTVLPGSFWLLVVSVSVPVGVLLVAAVLLLLCRLKTNRNMDDMNTTAKVDDRNSEICPYEISPPRATCEGSIYQMLDPASRDHDQIYSTLT